MSWDGPAGKGALKELRRQKREEAEERNKRTPAEQRRQTRLEYYRTGRLAPHPGSRDARVLRDGR